MRPTSRIAYSARLATTLRNETITSSFEWFCAKPAGPSTASSWSRL